MESSDDCAQSLNSGLTISDIHCDYAWSSSLSLCEAIGTSAQCPTTCEHCDRLAGLCARNPVVLRDLSHHGGL